MSTPRWQILELSDTVKQPDKNAQGAITNMLETNEKIESFRKEVEDKKKNQIEICIWKILEANKNISEWAQWNSRMERTEEIISKLGIAQFGQCIKKRLKKKWAEPLGVVAL